MVRFASFPTCGFTYFYFAERGGRPTMNPYAMFHAPNSPYCFPISENQIVLKLRTARDDMKQVHVFYESKYVIGQRQKSAPMEKQGSGQLYDYYTVTLTLEDTRLAYVFYVDDGREQYYFSEDGLTKEYDYSLGFYNFFQYPFINQADVMPGVDWMKTAVFYQIFVDRFYRGDDLKDGSYINLKWGDIPNPKSFAGGDLPGITEKLDHIASLGCNAIYLTPIFRSVSNHKYDIIEYYQVDRQFGREEDLRRLVETAHAKGIRIVMDAVFNHCSEECVPFQDVLKRGKESPYHDWFLIRGDKPDPGAVDEQKNTIGKANYEMFAACTYMPKWNTSNPEVQKYLTEIACYYLREFHIDGWRLDVCDEVSHEFWRYFRKEVKKTDPQAVIIGENWHDASDSLRGDQYDSIMNYAFTKSCLDYFAWKKRSAAQMADHLNDLRMRNTDTVNGMLLNLLDSHDTHRFFSEVKEDPEAVKAALCLLYLFPGVPCIFYGTEILMPGGFDPDCRRCMDWSKTGEKGEYGQIHRLLKQLADLRTAYPPAEGTVSIRAEKDVLILKNQCKSRDAAVTLLINRTETTRTVEGITVPSGGYVIRVNDREVLER